MTPANPFTAINVNGTGTMRGVTLALPAAKVRAMLPAGLELGAQQAVHDRLLLDGGRKDVPVYGRSAG